MESSSALGYVLRTLKYGLWMNRAEIWLGINAAA